MGMGMMGGFGLLMMMFGLLITVGVVVLIIWAVLHLTRNAGLATTGGSHARQILDQRYARGEIGQEEYQRIRRELG